MTTPAVINRDAFYDVEASCRTLGLRRGPVNAARLKGDLRSVRRAGKVLIKGAWLEDWLVGAAPAMESASR
jgi:hypothetical protein